MIDPKPVEHRQSATRAGRYVVVASFLLCAAATAYTYFQPPAHLGLDFVAAFVDQEIR